MKIQRNGSQASKLGPAEYFTGTVRVDTPFQAEEPGRLSGAFVTFEPGARTAWHRILRHTLNLDRSSVCASITFRKTDESTVG